MCRTFRFFVVLNMCLILNIHLLSGSMENTINTDTYLLCNRIAYKNSLPKRYDIVVFQYPLDENVNYVKRIIGLPGEHVEVKNGKIFINNEKNAIAEPYLNEEWYVDNDGYCFDIPENAYLMLGDNRNDSDDARYWAANALGEGLVTNEKSAQNYTYVSQENILAKVWIQYRPEIKLIH